MQEPIPAGHIYYQERGGGPTLALLHAFPLHSDMWAPQLEGLQDSCRLIAMDMRGFGRTPLETAPYALEALTRDLAALMDALGQERFVLGGLSMGGYVALAFQRLFGDRLAGLILADTRAGADSPGARERRYQTIREVEAYGMGPLSEAMPRSLLCPETFDLQPALPERIASWIARTDPRAVIAAQRAMAERPDATPQLRGVGVPTLVLVGSQDTLSPPEEAEAMASQIPGAQLAIIPHAGHLANLENPVAFNRAVREFMARIDL